MSSPLRNLLWAALAISWVLQAFGKDCPAERSFAPNYGEGRRSAKISFESFVDDLVNLYWLNDAGQEVFTGSLPPRRLASFNTIVGHIFRARIKDTAQLLTEVVAADPADGTTPFPVEACGESALPEHDLNDHAWLAEGHGRRESAALQDCPLSTLLSGSKVPGLHVLCFTTDAEGSKPDHLCVFKDGLEQDSCSASIRISGDETAIQLLDILEKQLGLKKRHTMAPPPALFTASGRRIAGEMSLAKTGVPSYRRALVMSETGVWAWPPVEVGFTRPMQLLVQASGDPGDSAGVALRTLALRPRVFEVKHFLEEVEVDRVLEKAGPHVARSEVVLKDEHHGRNSEDWRTSANYFLQSNGDDVLMHLDERVQNLTRVPTGNSEHAQILRYDYMGRYVAHHDFFDPKDYAKDPGTLELIGHGAYNRFATVFMYMSDVEAGGETIFPSHNGGNPGDFAQCERGYKVKPERRKVIIFYDMHPSGALDKESLHGGCRVKNGTKWSANYWIWNTPRAYKRSRHHMKMMKRLSKWDEAADRREEEANWQLHVETMKARSERSHAGENAKRSDLEL